MSWDAVARLLDGGLVARRDLRRAGVCPRWLNRQVTAGRLVRLHPGVLAVPGLTMDLPNRFRAALLQAGHDAVLSHTSALEVYGLVEGWTHDVVHVCVPRSGARGCPGVVVHQRVSRGLRSVQGLPVVPVDEAVIGSAELMPLEELRFPAMQAVHDGLMLPADLAVVEHAPARLTSAMALLAEEAAAGAESGGEANYFRLVLDAGLPRPRLQAVVDTYRGLKRVDAYWDRLLLGCEIDGDRWHSSKEARERDRGRRNAIQGERVKLFDFSVAEVMRSPRTVLEDTEANLLARARELRIRAWWL